MGFGPSGLGLSNISIQCTELDLLFAFELDLETTTHPLARNYQEIVIEQQKAKEKPVA